MKYINELKPGDRVSRVFLMRSRSSAVAKNGKTYDNVTLQDKTNSLDAKIWDPSSAGIEDVDAPAYVEVSGDVKEFMGKLQMSITRLRVADPSEFDEGDFLPVSPYSVDSMYGKIMEFIDSVENPYLNKLLHSFFDDEEFAEQFKKHSAAKSVHHGFVGGLAQHTCFVTRLCDRFADLYSILNRDLLITAAICHDIGKVRELSLFPENEYTDEGQLLGHIVIGIQMISEKVAQIDGFPKDLSAELLHCIAAHHGEFEFGSPKKPAIAEAMALNMADNTDAKMEIFTELLNNGAPDSYDWLGFQKFLGSNVRRTHREWE